MMRAAKRVGKKMQPTDILKIEDLDVYYGNLLNH